MTLVAGIGLLVFAEPAWANGLGAVALIACAVTVFALASRPTTELAGRQAAYPRPVRGRDGVLDVRPCSSIRREAVVTEIASVEVTVWVPASPSDVFGFFTDPDRYVQWMGSSAELDPVPG